MKLIYIFIINVVLPFQKNRLDILCCIKLSDRQEENNDGILYRFFKKIYAPFILKDWVRPLVVRLIQCSQRSRIISLLNQK